VAQTQDPIHEQFCALAVNQIRNGADLVDLAKKNDLTNHDKPRAWCKRLINCVKDLLCRCRGCGVMELANRDAVACGALRQRVVERAMLRRRGWDFVARFERPVRQYGCDTFRGVAKQRNILGRGAL
jgi:hypothetical protein